MDQNENLMTRRERLGDAVMQNTVRVPQTKRPLARRATFTDRNEGANLVVGRVGFLPWVVAENLRKAIRLNRPAQRRTKPVARDKLRHVEDNDRAGAVIL